jgi:hypothetical protein
MYGGITPPDSRPDLEEPENYPGWEDSHFAEAGDLTEGERAQLEDLIAQLESRLYTTREEVSKLLFLASKSPKVRKRLGRVCKKLKGQALTTNEGKRVVTYCLTAENSDRDQETVSPTGGVYDEFALNPLVILHHDTETIPVGSLGADLAGPVPDGMEPVHDALSIWNDWVGEGTRYPMVGGPRRLGLLGNVYFSKVSPEAERVYQQVLERTFLGGSLSFIPLGHPLRNELGGNYYDRWQMLEWSLVAIPSNASAIAVKTKRYRKTTEDPPELISDYETELPKLEPGSSIGPHPKGAMVRPTLTEWGTWRVGDQEFSDLETAMDAYDGQQRLADEQ